MRVSKKLSGGPSTGSALLFTVAIAVILFVPIGLVTYHIAQQSDLLQSWIGRARDNGVPVPDWVAHLPFAAQSIEQWWRDNLAKPESVTVWLQGLNADKAGDVLKSFGGQLLNRGFMLVVALIVLFTLLRNGQLVARQLHTASDRIFGQPGEGLVDKTVDAIRGTVNGTVAVAFLEGLLIGVGYLVAGVPNAMLFTILTVAFAMLPFGAWAAFSAAALTLLVSGGSGAAATLVVVWGAVVMLAGDHFVWPTLVGGAARLPFVLAFIGIFGGMASFGLVGLFIGPVIMAAVLTIWREWVVRNRPVS